MIIEPEGIKNKKCENWKDFEHKKLAKMEECDNFIIAL